MSEETLDTLFQGKLKVLQSRKGYRFSLDALLLAHFVSVKRDDTVADFGTGNGVIALLLASLHSHVSITGIELQQAMVERAERNVKLNGLEARIRICRGDVRAIDAVGRSESFDVVVCNPPFRKPSSGRISPNDEKRIARHEFHGELRDFLAAATFLLRPKGRLALVYSAARAVELLLSMHQARVEPKRLRTIHSFADAKASLVLAEGVKSGRAGLAVEKPLTIYRRKHEYTEEVAAVISGVRR